MADYSPSKWNRPGTYCRPCQKALNQGRPCVVPHPARACAYCSIGYVPKHVVGAVSYCSPECKEKARTERRTARTYGERPTRICLHCGGPLRPKARVHAKFCSRACVKAAHHMIRNFARRANSPAAHPRDLISRNSIANRDGWRCKLCGGKINKALSWPEPLSPSLDHVVPLAVGGGNEVSNLQIAHLRCNIAKGARAMDDQLRWV